MLSWRFAILSERLVKVNQALFIGDYWRLITCNYYFPIWIQSADCDGDSPPPQCCLFFSSLSGGLITPQNLLWVSAHFHMLCSPIVPLPQWHSALFNFSLWKWRQLTRVHLKSEYAHFFILILAKERDWFLGGIANMSHLSPALLPWEILLCRIEVQCKNFTATFRFTAYYYVSSFILSSMFSLFHW